MTDQDRMKKQTKSKLNPAEKMLVAKRKYITRLEGQIRAVLDDADARVAKIRARIRIAAALADALEKGTLEP